MVWGLVAGVLLIAASVWLYRHGLKVYGVIAVVLGIALLLMWYWSAQVIDDTDVDVPAGTVEGIATPDTDEGGV